MHSRTTGRTSNGKAQNTRRNGARKSSIPIVMCQSPNWESNYYGNDDFWIC